VVLECLSPLVRGTASACRAATEGRWTRQLIVLYGAGSAYYEHSGMAPPVGDGNRPGGAGVWYGSRWWQRPARRPVRRSECVIESRRVGSRGWVLRRTCVVPADPGPGGMRGVVPELAGQPVHGISMVTGVDIRQWLCVVFSSYRERQCRAGAGDDGTTREVRQGGQVAGAIQWTGFDW
jgi:hypothetical protein